MNELDTQLLDIQLLREMVFEAHAKGMNLNEYMAMLVFNSVGKENPQ